MYVYRNIEARSCNHCCGGKAISITYCECVFVALSIQHAMRMRHVSICGLSGSTIFFHINKRHHFRKKTPLNKKMCILIFCTTFVTNMSHYKKNSARCDKKHITSSVYDCTVEDVEYHNVAIVTHIRHLVTARHGYAVTSSTLLADPPSNETIDAFYIKMYISFHVK